MARLRHHWVSMARPGGVTLLDDYSMARGVMHGQIVTSLDERGTARQVHITGRAQHSTAGRGMAGTWPHLVAFPEPSPRHCCRHCRARQIWPGLGQETLSGIWHQ